MEPSVLQGRPGAQLPPEEGSASLHRPPAAAGRSLRGTIQGTLSIVFLQAGLLNCYFCLKRVHLDLLRWIRASLELLANFCCCCVQNAVLANILPLLLVWKLLAGARKRGQRTSLHGLALQGQLTQGLSLLRSCGCHLETLLAWMTWWPAHCFIYVIGRVAWALEVIYDRAVRIAGEEEGKVAGAPVPLLPPEQI